MPNMDLTGRAVTKAAENDPARTAKLCHQSGWYRRSHGDDEWQLLKAM
jgi:hypothetical protein